MRTLENIASIPVNKNELRATGVDGSHNSFGSLSWLRKERRKY